MESPVPEINYMHLPACVYLGLHHRFLKNFSVPIRQSLCDDLITIYTIDLNPVGCTKPTLRLYFTVDKMKTLKKAENNACAVSKTVVK